MKEEEGNLILLISVLYIKKEEEGKKHTWKGRHYSSKQRKTHSTETKIQEH